MVYNAYTFKNVFNYEENDIFGVPLILVDYWTSRIFLTFIERCYHCYYFEPSYPDYSRLGSNRKACYTVLYCSNRYSCFGKRNIEFVQNIH
jgi:hypothetical protein